MVAYKVPDFVDFLDKREIDLDFCGDAACGPGEAGNGAGRPLDFVCSGNALRRSR
jgi:hypothetical protein